MNLYGFKYFKTAIYFVFFEALYWLLGKDIGLAFKSKMWFGNPIIYPVGGQGYFYNYFQVGISVVALFASIFFLTLFIKNLIEMVREPKH